MKSLHSKSYQSLRLSMSMILFQEDLGCHLAQPLSHSESASDALPDFVHWRLSHIAGRRPIWVFHGFLKFLLVVQGVVR